MGSQNGGLVLAFLIQSTLIYVAGAVQAVSTLIYYVFFAHWHALGRRIERLTGIRNPIYSESGSVFNGGPSWIKG
jgi:hypothetical protein